MMKNIRYNFLRFTFLITLILGLVISCTRDLDDLEPASFPTTAEVFLDDFSAGLNYAAFGGSKTTAFNVVIDESYKGSASMRFDIPDAGDPEGGFAAGIFFTDAGRDLSSYDALTFWAKATESASIDEVGFGFTFGEEKYRTALKEFSVGTSWKKYIVPLPDASKLTEEKGMFYYIDSPDDGKGYTFWVDEVQFEKLGTIAHPKPAILETQDQVVSAETGDKLPIGGLFSTFNLPTGIDQRVDLSPWYYTFSSSNTSVAMVDELGLVSVIDSGTATITAKLGDLDALGSLTIESTGTPVAPPEPAPTPTVSADSVISMFSNAYTNVTVDTWNPFWEFSTTEVADIKVMGDDVKRYKQLNFVGILTESEPIDATEMTHFHLDIWTPDPTNPPAAFKVLLVDFGGDGNFGGGDDSSHELTFTSPTLATESWVSLDIPLSDFIGLVNRAQISQLVLSGDLRNVFVDNVYYYKSGDSGESEAPTEAAPTPTQNEADVISIFSDAYTNVEGTDFNPNWGQATVVSQTPVDGNNTLLYSGLNYQGIQLGSNLDVSEMEFLHLDFWTANSTALSAFLISSGPVETAYTLSVPTSGWASVDVPLSDFSPVDLADLIQFKFDGNGNIYLDNIYFHKGDGGGATEPTEPAPTPGQDAANVISVFSDAYTDIEGTDFNPDWGQSTIVTTEEIAGNNTLKYANFNYQGTQLGSTQDVSNMQFLHIDMWTADATDVKATPISLSSGEQLVALTPITPGQWNSYDIPLSAFSDAGVSLNDLHQLKFDGQAGVTPSNIYLDNIYFYGDGGSSATEPTQAAPTPSQDAANVISVFSDAYTDIEGTDFNPNWGQSTMVSTEAIAGNNTLKYANFNYQGTQLGSTQDVSNMQFLHIDMWTADATDVKATPISISSGEQLIALAPITPGQWNSYDIPLSAFSDAGVSLNDLHQLKFDGQAGVTPSNIYLDNIYFYGDGGSSATEPTQAAPTPTQDAANVISVFSDAYTSIEGTDFNPNWGQSTMVSTEAIAGNNTLKYANFNYQGTQLGSTQDVSAMEFLHIDMWTADATDVKATPISISSGEQLVALTPIAPGQWNGYDIPLSAFSDAGVSLSDLHQLKFDGQAGVTPSNIYLDNIYFYKNGDGGGGELTQAAPAPTHEAANVISLFSDAYVDVNVDTWRTDWSSATLEDITVDGNATKKYSALDFVGVETVSSTIDASEMTHFRIDVWSADFTVFGIKLVDFGADGAFGGGDDVEHQINFDMPAQGGWISYDIPLSDFTGLTTRGNLAQYILVGQPTGATTIYVDNIYFRK